MQLYVLLAVTVAGAMAAAVGPTSLVELCAKAAEDHTIFEQMNELEHLCDAQLQIIEAQEALESHAADTKEKKKNEFIRFGKRKNEFIRFGKRAADDD